MGFQSKISIEPGIRFKVENRVYEVVSPITLPYSDNQGQGAGLYFLTPTGGTVRQAANLEPGDVRTQALNIINGSAARYHDLVSRVEAFSKSKIKALKLGRDELDAFKRLSSLFRIVETA